MLIYDSLQPAMRACVETRTFAIARLYNNEKTMCDCGQDCCEVCFSIAADKVYECHFLSPADQVHCLRIVIFICPEYLGQFSTEHTDLSYCFSRRDPLWEHRSGMTEEERERFLYFIHKLSQERGYGQDVLDQAGFLELMIFLNGIVISRYPRQACAVRDAVQGALRSRHAQIDEILDYIDRHLAERISIPVLSAHFYISGSYLSRIFKDATGTTINQYIIAKRISHAEVLLADGHSVAETSSLCGFGDYSNFLKAFTRAVGISPKKYAAFARC